MKSGIRFVTRTKSNSLIKSGFFDYVSLSQSLGHSFMCIYALSPSHRFIMPRKNDAFCQRKDGKIPTLDLKIWFEGQVDFAHTH